MSNPNGRPKKEFSEQELAEVQRLASIGLTSQQIGDWFGITGEAVRSRTFDSPEFRNAIKSGRALGVGAVSNTLFQKAMAGSETSMIFYLKTQGKWRESKPMAIDDALEVLMENGILPPDWADTTVEVTEKFQEKLLKALHNASKKRSTIYEDEYYGKL